jgi:hypothetical protein
MMDNSNMISNENVVNSNQNYKVENQVITIIFLCFIEIDL